MTTEEITSRIDKIRSVAWDDEVAHAKEDELRSDFINYVATLDNQHLAEKAKLVASTSDIDFARWCA